jgi:hypothetical protein
MFDPITGLVRGRCEKGIAHTVRWSDKIQEHHANYVSVLTIYPSSLFPCHHPDLMGIVYTLFWGGEADRLRVYSEIF